MESSETDRAVGNRDTLGRQPLSPLNLGLTPPTLGPGSAKVGSPRVAPPGNSSSRTQPQSPLTTGFTQARAAGTVGGVHEEVETASFS